MGGCVGVRVWSWYPVWSVLKRTRRKARPCLGSPTKKRHHGLWFTKFTHHLLGLSFDTSWVNIAHVSSGTSTKRLIIGIGCRVGLWMTCCQSSIPFQSWKLSFPGPEAAGPSLGGQCSPVPWCFPAGPKAHRSRLARKHGRGTSELYLGAAFQF